MNKIDFSAIEVQLVIALLVFLCALFLSLFFFFLYFFKFIIPKSKLFDDEYLRRSIRNVTIFRKSSLVILIIQLIILVLKMIIVNDPFAATFSPFWLIYSVIMLLALIFSLGPVILHPYNTVSRNPRKYFSGGDIEEAIYSKRLQEKHKTQGWKL